MSPVTSAPLRGSMLAIAFAVLLVGTCAAQATEAPDPSVQFYADTYDVPYGEAERRLHLVASAGALQARMQRELPETFAGMYVEHVPRLRFVALFTGNAKDQLARYTSDPAYVAKQAPRPLKVLESIQFETADQLARGRHGFESSIDVRNSEIHFDVLDAEAAAHQIRHLLAAFDFIKITSTRSLPQPLQIEAVPP